MRGRVGLRAGRGGARGGYPGSVADASRNGVRSSESRVVVEICAGRVACTVPVGIEVSVGAAETGGGVGGKVGGRVDLLAGHRGQEWAVRHGVGEKYPFRTTVQKGSFAGARAAWEFAAKKCFKL